MQVQHKPTWELKHLMKDLSVLTSLNTAKENKRLKEVKKLLKKRNKVSENTNKYHKNSRNI